MHCIALHRILTPDLRFQDMLLREGNKRHVNTLSKQSASVKKCNGCVTACIILYISVLPMNASEVVDF